MNYSNAKIILSCVVGLIITVAAPFTRAAADTRAAMEKEARSALQELYRDTPTAKVLGDKAAAILVFPRITKGGFIIGGQYGEGTLL